MRSLVSSRLAVAVAALAAFACAKEKPAEEAAVPAPPPPPNVVHVEAADYSFTLADTLPSGVTPSI
jgi:predicted outer membrane protein